MTAPTGATPTDLIYPRVAWLLGVGDTQEERRQSIIKGIEDLYSEIRREILAGHYWGFAEDMAIIRKAAKKPVFGYANFLTLPADLIHITFFNLTQEVGVHLRRGWQRFGNYIACDSEVGYLSYTKDLQDTKLFSPMFLKAIQYQIAKELSLSVAGDKDLGDRLDEMARSIVFETIEIDYRDQGTRETIQGMDVLQSRMTGSLTGAETPAAEVAQTPLPGLVTPTSNQP